MCEKSPGPRCASDTRQVARLASRAYYEAYGPDAPPIDAVTHAQELMKDKLAGLDAARVSAYAEDLRALRAQHANVPASDFAEVAKGWRDDSVAAVSGRPTVDVERDCGPHGEATITSHPDGTATSLVSLYDPDDEDAVSEVELEHATPEDAHVWVSAMASSHDMQEIHDEPDGIYEVPVASGVARINLNHDEGVEVEARIADRSNGQPLRVRTIHSSLQEAVSHTEVLRHSAG